MPAVILILVQLCPILNLSEPSLYTSIRRTKFHVPRSIIFRVIMQQTHTHTDTHTQTHTHRHTHTHTHTHQDSNPLLWLTYLISLTMFSCNDDHFRAAPSGYPHQVIHISNTQGTSEQVSSPRGGGPDT